ncbi:MAG: efflux RND transporter permease subunit [Candidatus Zixiibacteriota bacterium]
MGLPDFSVKRPVAISMLIMIIVVIGGFALYNLGLELFPDITYPVISVMTSYEGASPEDVEQMITRPIEENIATISNVKSVKSISYEGISTVMTEFEWGTNLDFAAQDIRDRISLIEGYLPEGIGDPLVLKFDISMMPVLVMGASGMEDTEKMRDVLDDVLADRLKRVGGVANVSIMGGDEDEIQVLLNPAKLQNLGINPNTIVQALYAQNINQPAGYVEFRHKEYLIRTKGEFEDIDEIGNIMVGMTANHEPIYIEDVAEVKQAYKFNRSTNKIAGQEGIFLMIMKESGANTVKTTAAVKKELENIKDQLPEQIKLFIMFDQGDFITKIAKRTGSNALIGALLAIVMIFLFLRSSRPTMTISLAIPFSVIATFIAIWLADYTLNIITMAGLALGIGMLVDNAIVVIENIHRHIELGQERKIASALGAKEVAMAITASTLTTVAVFFPLLFASGITGKLSRGMALTVTFALFASLFVAVSLVPMIASQLFDRRNSKKLSSTEWFNPARRFYLKALDKALEHRPTTLIIAGIIFAISLAMIPLVGTEFMPKSDPPVVSATLELPVGITLNETSRIANNLLKTMEDIEDIEFSGYSAGVSSTSEMDIATGEASASVNKANIYIRLKPKKDRKYSSEEIANIMRRNLPPLEGVNLIIEESGMAMGASNSFDIKVFGNNLDRLSKLADIISERLEEIEGLSDIEVSLKRGKPEYDIIVNRTKASFSGLTIGEVASLIKIYTIGQFAGRFRKEGEETDIRVKVSEEERANISQIEMLPIFTRMAKVIPLSQIARIDETQGPIAIERDEQKRKVSITCNVAGSDLGSKARIIKRELQQLTDAGVFPTGYSYSIGGQYEDMQTALGQLIVALLAAVLLVYMVMAAQFESFLYPFVIIFTVPMSLVGVVLALLISGHTISIVSFFGFIILTGIVVNNGIVLIDYMNQQRRSGVSGLTAIRRGGVVRLRPVLITALTTIFGMLPMTFSTSEGSEFRGPMAIGIVGGLIASTLLTLLVIPVLYSLFSKIDVKEKTEKSLNELLETE